MQRSAVLEDALIAEAARSTVISKHDAGSHPVNAYSAIDRVQNFVKLPVKHKRLIRLRHFLQLISVQLTGLGEVERLDRFRM